MAGGKESKDMIFEEYVPGLAMGFAVKERLLSQKSDFQKVEIVESTHHGRMLFNDNCAMISERDERIYHEMMVHVPMFVHPSPQRVLVIGGGDGGTAREVLRHPSVEKVVMVEIDAVVVEGCRKFIPQTSAALSSPKLELIIGDGVEYVKKNRGQFDVILIDSTDPIGPAAPLFGREFYGNVAKCLAPDGIVVAQGESPFYAAEAQRSLLKILGGEFKMALPYNFTNLTYPGGLWSFMWASHSWHPQRHFHSARVSESRLDFYYYNPSVHMGALAWPEFMRVGLKDLIKDHA